MMSKEAKKNYVEEMKKNFTENESVMIAQYQGLNVNELDSLRKELREKGIVGSSLQAELKISAPLEIYKSLSFFDEELKYILITSNVILSSSKKDLKIEVNASDNNKCDRCWHYVDDIGQNSEHSTICKRCISNLFEEGEERKHA